MNREIVAETHDLPPSQFCPGLASLGRLREPKGPGVLVGTCPPSNFKLTAFPSHERAGPSHERAGPSGLEQETFPVCLYLN